jgi:hypothetical protein
MDEAALVESGWQVLAWIGRLHQSLKKAWEFCLGDAHHLGMLLLNSEVILVSKCYFHFPFFPIIFILLFQKYGTVDDVQVHGSFPWERGGLHVSVLITVLLPNIMNKIPCLEVGKNLSPGHLQGGQTHPCPGARAYPSNLVEGT